MKHKSLFSSDEWEKLKCSFPFVFYLIAGADKKIDKKEKIAISRIIQYPDRLKNKLAYQLITDMENNFFDTVIHDASSNLSSLIEISKILDEKLEAGRSLKFKKVLIAIGIYIANASGDFFSAKMSEIEADAINKIAATFSLSVDDLNTEPSVQKILKKIKKKLTIYV